MKKTLTVFTPTYNRAYCLQQVYDSLLNQTCPDFEWMVIDDGSTDDTKALVNKWIEENKIVIKYIYQPNQGMHGARLDSHDISCLASYQIRTIACSDGINRIIGGKSTERQGDQQK